MAKFAPAATLDSELDYIGASDRIIVCSTQPTTYAEATSTFALATATATPGTDFTKGNGTGTGARALTVAGKTGVSVAVSGTATHVAVARSTDSTLRYVTTCTSQALTAGNTVNVPSWAINKTQPT